MGGVPHLSSRKEANVLVAGNSVARRAWGWLESLLGGKPVCLCVFLFVFCAGCFLFPRKVPCQSSKFGLADSWEMEIYLHLVRKPECYRGKTRLWREEDRAFLGSFPGPCFPGNFCSFLFLLSSPYQKRLDSERSPKHSLILPRLVPPTPTQGTACHGEGTLSSPSEFLSSTGRGAGIHQA